MNYDSKIEASSIDASDTHGELDPFADLDQQGRVRRRRIIVLVAIALVAVLALWWFLHRGGEEDALSKDADQIPVVTVVAPGRSTVAGAIGVTGTLAARRSMPVGSVGDGGQVREVRVEPGQWVSQGQVLAVIDRSVQTQQIASQQAQVEVASADARIAQANLDRALKLVDRGFISKADVDKLTATRDSAAAQVKVARATLGQLQAQTARLNILAPASGLVLERSVELGQVVSGGSGVLFRLAKDGEMELLAALSEDDLAGLSVGQEAKVTPVGSGKTFIGHVWQISPVINQTSRQGVARVALAYDPALRPGGFASVTIQSGTQVAPMLPESAIQNDTKGSFVYVVDAKGVAHRQAVKTGLVTAKGVIITDGLSGSEKVVMRAGGFLNDGDKVKTRLVAAGR
ncbi:secretion protein HlyD [Novosphingobium sp. Rr 2-17]|uniref:efflux RND transporter periplasmic adaptor subunit n=1 Tax=Novosphingobium sp. Rr 2-17 TaxID=555793 RepID=UPI0002699875|nr:efflux RND transporter periplasmic adaptor subunit [Novosphingobium sp. Rr 2-17]EIZ79050.1 secretion protein HlyD [Novosphingobium sp. Rr 2-17]